MHSTSSYSIIDEEDDKISIFEGKKREQPPQPKYRGWFYASINATLLVVLIALVAIFYERGHPGDASLITLVSWTLTPQACLRDEEGLCSPALGHAPEEHPPLLNATSMTNHSNDSTSSTSSTDCILYSTHKYYFYTRSSSDQETVFGMENTVCNLIGESTLYEREGKNLFSVMGIPFILLSTQVIATSFSLLYIRKDMCILTANETKLGVRKTLKKMALFLLLIFSICFFFIQTTWKLPGNNLFLVEIFLLFAFIAIASIKAVYVSEDAGYQIMTMRLVENWLTTSLLSVAVLPAAGNTSTNDLSATFFSILFANAFFVLLELEKHSYSCDDGGQNPSFQLWRQAYTFGKAQGVIMLNATLSMIPFLLHCILTLSDMRAGDTYKAWTVTPVLILFISQILFGVVITLYNWISYSTSGKAFGDRFIFSCFKKRSVPVLYDELETFLDFLCLIKYGGISLCIIGGAFVSFPSTTPATH